jgi:hypothetical protein
VNLSALSSLACQQLSDSTGCGMLVRMRAGFPLFEALVRHSQKNHEETNEKTFDIRSGQINDA